jgi:S1-C subfamily serine protease
MLAGFLCVLLTAACAGGVVDKPSAPVEYDSLLPGTIGLAFAASGRDIVVAAVRPGSAAARAGVREGDRITRCNGEPVENLRALERRVLDSRPGSAMRLELARGSETFAVELPVEEMVTAVLA